MLRVMTIVGTRPELIRLSRTIALLDRHCTHTLVHTGQNYDYELNQIFFEDLGIRTPDHFLDASGATAAETIGNVIIKSDELFAQHKTDALLILGDGWAMLDHLHRALPRTPDRHQGEYQAKQDGQRQA